MKKLFMLFFVGGLPTIIGANSIYAQTDSVSMQTVLPDSVKPAVTVTIPNHYADSIVNFFSAKIDSLEKVIANWQSELNQKDKQIESLKESSNKKDIEIQKLTKERAFVDTCMSRLANRWLYEKYNEKDVKEAIGYFDRILSTQVRKDSSVILELLQNYGAAYSEFQTILKTAQADEDRENPFATSEYKSRYINRIKSMTYYIKYYNASWNIRYLNEKIEEALKRLNNHSDTKPASFTDLID